MNPTDNVPYFKPDINEDDIQAVVDTLRSGWLTTGPAVTRFETAFAEYVGAPHAVALNSCTAALHLGLAAWGIGPGDEVIVPTMTFAATANVVEHLGARPVLVDIKPSDLNVDPIAIERAINRHTRAIIPVHFAGQPCDMDPIMELAAAHGLKVLEDAAHALPAAYRSTRVGNISDATCFSFYANKTMTTGEGGMLTTADEDLAGRVRVISLHGLSKEAGNRYAFAGSWEYQVVAAGYKNNMTDMAASLGIEQLRRAPEFHENRSLIVERYREAFRAIPEVAPLHMADDRDHAWHLFVIKLDLERLSIDRAEFIAQMKESGVGASVHFKPLHLHPFYRETYSLDPADLPVATDTFGRIISLPLFPTMTDAEVDRVIEVVGGLVATHRR